MNLLFRQKKQQNVSEKKYSFRDVKNRIQEMLYDYTEKAVGENGLEEELHRNQEEYRRIISDCIRNCCSGKCGAKETVLDLIQSFLTEELQNQKNILDLVAFDEPERMTDWQRLETMIYLFDREHENRGFELLCNRFGWTENGFVVSEERVKQAYLELSPVFSKEDKKKIMSRLLFASTIGLGVIDTLNSQTGYIEEIQLGMSGRAEHQYNYKDTLLDEKEAKTYSRNGVHIMAKGNTIWLKVISFDTEEELQRVLRNLVRGTGSGELTKSNPMMVVDTVDGRRVSVSRPPVTDTWIGLIRKFDTVKEVSLEKLYQGYPEESILPHVLRQLIRSGRNIAITGEMASGKTTLFRACLAEAEQEMNIRVIEADSFELNVRGFLPQANSVTMRVTDQTPAEEVLAFARKTTGQIFAIGEINSASMANMAMDLSKIASQLFFSAHYITTEHMIADFVNAKLCVGGYSEELLAELDVVRCLGFDVHLRAKKGKRYVQYINEVIPKVNKKARGTASYEIRTIYQYDEEKEQGVIVNAPSEISYERAKQLLGKDEYLEFIRVFKR